MQLHHKHKCYVYTWTVCIHKRKRDNLYCTLIILLFRCLTIENIITLIVWIKINSQ